MRRTNWSFLGFWITYICILAAVLISCIGCGGGNDKPPLPHHCFEYPTNFIGPIPKQPPECL